MAIRAVIFEDHLLALEAMTAVLGEHPDIEIVAAASRAVGLDDLLQLMRDTPISLE